jgi:hypothetical protein
MDHHERRWDRLHAAHTSRSVSCRRSGSNRDFKAAAVRDALRRMWDDANAIGHPTFGASAGFYENASFTRLIAGDAGFFTLVQSRDGPCR